MKVSIVITGGEQAMAKLRHLGRDINVMPATMDKIGDYLAAYYANEGIRSAGQVFGTTWPKLSTAYANRKRKLYADAPMMVASGALQAGFRYTAGMTSVKIYNTQDYWKFHQSTEPRTKIPFRPSAGINRANVEKIKELVTEHINGLLAGI